MFGQREVANVMDWYEFADKWSFGKPQTLSANEASYDFIIWPCGLYESITRK